MAENVPIQNGTRGMRLNMEIGSPVSIRIEHFEQCFRGTLVGLEPQEYLIIKTIIPREFENAILPGIHFHVTYRSQCLEYGFSSTVIDTIDSPFRMTFLSYPQHVEILENRGSIRSTCYIPSSARLNSNTIKGIVTDISTSGCRFVIRLPENLQPRQILLIDDIVLHFPVVGHKGVQAFQGKVRNTTVDREKIAMGVEFDDLEMTIEQSLMDYVDRSADASVASNRQEVCRK